MNYNQIYLRASLLRDAAALKLPPKVVTERLLLSAYYMNAVAEFEQFKASVRNDPSATDDEKAAAIRAKANEDAGIGERRFSAESFGHIVEAALATDGIDTVSGSKIATDEWLEALAAELVDY